MPRPKMLDARCRMFSLGYDETAFSRDVIARWGHICSSLVDDEGIPHPQMAHLGRLCEAHPAVGPEIFPIPRRAACSKKMQYPKSKMPLPSLFWIGKRCKDLDFRRNSRTNWQTQSRISGIAIIAGPNPACPSGNVGRCGGGGNAASPDRRRSAHVDLVTPPFGLDDSAVPGRHHGDPGPGEGERRTNARRVLELRCVATYCVTVGLHGRCVASSCAATRALRCDACNSC